MPFFEPDAEGRRFTGKKKYIVLASASLLSLVFSLLLLEGLLELAGRVYRYSRQNDPIYSRVSGRIVKDSINVLALGDSFTFGGAGTGSKSYPAVLQRLLDEKYPGLLQVTNHGVCETTSKDVLENLATVVTFSRPDVVLLLTGSANLFDPYPFADELMSTAQKVDSFLKRRHVYKLLRHIYFELAAKAGRDVPEEVSKSRVDAGESPGEQALERLYQRIISEPDEARQRAVLEKFAAGEGIEAAFAKGLLQALAGDEAAVTTFRELKRKIRATGDDRGVESMFRNLRELLRRAYPDPLPSHVERTGLLLLKIGPPESVRHCVEPLVQLYHFNSSVDPMNAVRAIDDAIANDPILYRNRRLAAARITLSNMDAWRANVGVWYEQNLRELITRLSHEGIELILMTYPISYEPVNTIVRQIAKENGLALVDHEKLFAPLIAEDYKRYIRDDTHCTDAGHELMAGHVLMTMEQRFLKNEQRLNELKNHCSSNPAQQPQAR